MEDPLVQTLLNVYEKQTGLQGHEQVIGGGTFGRLLERGVAYGAMFPDSIDTMHQANEFTPWMIFSVQQPSTLKLFMN